MMESVYANAPFDHEKADIILRSSDNVDFRIFKLFLSLASPFFETLFDIPQPADPSDGQEIKDGLVVVPVAEDSKTLDALLRFCYPCTLADDPELEVLKDALDVLEAARKYSLDAVEKKARKAIANSKFLEREPLRCFVIAHQGRLREETMLSAKHTLTQPLIPTWFQEIELLTAADFLTLLTYHKNCGDAVHALRADSSWVTSHYGGDEAGNWLIGRYMGNAQNTERDETEHAYYDQTEHTFYVNTTRRTNYEFCGCQKSGASYTLFGNQPLHWWEQFMKEVFTELRDKPCKATVQSAAEKTTESVKGKNCSICAPRVTEAMRDFSDLLVRKVEEAVSKIELDLKF